MQVTRSDQQNFSGFHEKLFFIHRLHTSAVEQVEQLIEFMPVGGEPFVPDLLCN